MMKYINFVLMGINTIILITLLFISAQLKAQNDVYGKLEAFSQQIDSINILLIDAAETANTIWVNIGEAKLQQDILIGAIRDEVNSFNRASQ